MQASREKPGTRRRSIALTLCVAAFVAWSAAPLIVPAQQATTQRIVPAPRSRPPAASSAATQQPELPAPSDSTSSEPAPEPNGPARDLTLEEAPGGVPLRDPTTVRPDLRRLLDPPTVDTAAASAAPTVQLRGRISLPNGSTRGMIEINGQIYSVSEGTRISTGSDLTVEIRKLDADGVEVEIQPTGQILNLQ